MDTRKLKKEVKGFIKDCELAGYAINHCCLVEAFPGDPTTSYIMHIGADWIENYDCYTVLKKLTKVMWASMTREARERIFSINIYDKHEKLHCATDAFLLMEDGSLAAA